MEITEVRIKLMDDASDRLKAFCSITLDDCFVVRDLKIIDGTNGPFVAMPSRKLTARCPKCGCKNHLKASYCNDCGNRLQADRAVQDENGRAKLYADIAHPINSHCREMMQRRVIAAYEEELERSKQPGYVSSYEEFDVDEQFDFRRDQPEPELHRPSRPQQPAAEPQRPSRGQPLRGPHSTGGPQKTETHRDTPHTPNSDEFGAGIF